MSVRSRVERICEAVHEKIDGRSRMVTRGRPPSGRSSYDTLTLACLSGADLGPKLVSAERALSAIRAGSRVYIGTGCAAPRTLLAQLEAMNPAPADLEFVSFVTTS